MDNKQDRGLMEDTSKGYAKVDNVQSIDWDDDEIFSKINWGDPKSNPLYNMHNIWIARNVSDDEFSIFMDKPTLEKDGVWRSSCGNGAILTSDGYRSSAESASTSGCSRK